MFRTPIRWQFRLLSLFIVMTLVAAAAAAIGIRRHALIAEDNALRLVAAQGGSVMLYQEGAYVEFFTTPPTGPLVASCGTGLEKTYGPTGTSAEFRDDDLALFDHVRSMQSVNFKNTGVSLAAVQRFRAAHPDCYVED
jgi:hypothetical protein